MKREKVSKGLEDVAGQLAALNAIVVSICIACSLRMKRDNIVRALGGGGATRLLLPEEHPLDVFDLGDGPKGPIPDEIELVDFVWQGGAESWRVRPLRQFASLTEGSASFVLVDVDGGLHAYEIEDGGLYSCDVAMAFARRGSAIKLRSATGLLKAVASTRAGKGSGRALAAPVAAAGG